MLEFARAGAAVGATSATSQKGANPRRVLPHARRRRPEARRGLHERPRLRAVASGGRSAWAGRSEQGRRIDLGPRPERAPGDLPQALRPRRLGGRSARRAHRTRAASRSPRSRPRSRRSGPRGARPRRRRSRRCFAGCTRRPRDSWSRSSRARCASASAKAWSRRRSPRRSTLPVTTGQARPPDHRRHRRDRRPLQAQASSRPRPSRSSSRSASCSRARSRRRRGFRADGRGQGLDRGEVRRRALPAPPRRRPRRALLARPERDDRRISRAGRERRRDWATRCCSTARCWRTATARCSGSSSCSTGSVASRSRPSCAQEVPVVLVIFDLLHLDGRVAARRAAARSGGACSRASASSLRFCSPASRRRRAPTDLDRIFADTRERGNEGLMVKDPMSPYTPGRRGLAWLKLKRPLATLDVRGDRGRVGPRQAPGRAVRLHLRGQGRRRRASWSTSARPTPG